MKRMRKFYEEWCASVENRPLLADDLEMDIIPFDSQHIVIRPLTVEIDKNEQAA